MQRAMCAARHAAHAYTSHQVSRADPMDLVVQLYDGAIARILQAREDHAGGRSFEANRSIGKALAIIGELQAVLDLERGGEVARNLDRIYDFFRRRLLESQTQGDAAGLSEVVDLMRSLREAWGEAQEKWTSPEEAADAR